MAMKIDLPHQLDQQEATARVAALTHYWDTKYGTHTTWTDNNARINGRVRGLKFDGTFEVLDRRLTALIKVSFLAERIGGRGYVERKLQDYLNPDTKLEALRARSGLS